MLNLPGHHSVAAIASRLSIDVNKHINIEGSLDISDCNKVISLCLNAFKSENDPPEDFEEELDNIEFKLSTLMKITSKTLLQFRKMRKKINDSNNV